MEENMTKISLNKKIDSFLKRTPFYSKLIKDKTNYLEIDIGSVEEFINFIMILRDKAHWSFRGQRDESWPLGIHIERFSKPCKLNRDDYLTHIFNQFKRRCVEHTGLFVPSPPPENDEWRWLFYAQHYGLQTRLLDWTSNPLVALYFAVENIFSIKEDSIGTVWALAVDKDHIKLWNQLNEENDKNFNTPQNALNYAKEDPDYSWFMVNPPFNIPRVSRQSARFSFHADQDIKSIDSQPRRNSDEVLFKIILRNKVGNPSKKILKQLGVMNINHASLFPDPSGLAQFINSQWTEIGLIESVDTEPHLYSLGFSFEETYD
jgi:hypothetical protein